MVLFVPPVSSVPRLLVTIPRLVLIDSRSFGTIVRFARPDTFFSWLTSMKP
jgi:hypothetical protein